MDADRRHPGFDTLTGYDPDEDDPVMAALDDLDAAVAERGKVIEELQKRSVPPPPPPPLPPAVPAVSRAA